MNRTKANFKALRESLGMSQQLVADLLGVDKRSVKRWESPTAVSYGVAPDDAWELLAEYQQKQEWVISSSIDKVEEMHREAGRPRCVNLTYWFSEAEYEKAHPGEGRFWQMANANSRMVASILREEGYEVNFDFPGLRNAEEPRFG